MITEASPDVHDVLREAADRMAAQQWLMAGARSEGEMRAFLMSRLRRRMGLAAVQAMARHRLQRIPYIGATRASVEARMHRARTPREPAFFPEEFYAFQAGPLWGGGLAAAAA